jgi:hypothetical protein
MPCNGIVLIIVLQDKGLKPVNRKHRRIVAIALIAAGVALMLIAPDSNAGLIVLGCAVLIEIIGLSLQRRS